MFFSHQSCKTYKISSNSPASVVFTTTSWGWGWFSPHAVYGYIYMQMYNPKISGSMKVTKQEAGKKKYKTAQHTKLFQVRQSLSSLDLKKLLFGQLPLSPFTVHFIPLNRDWKVRTFPFKQALFTSLFTHSQESLTLELLLL